MMKKLENILLIEDDQITNFINQRLIKKLNFSLHVHSTLNGYEGLTYIKDCLKRNKEIPDLIFLDINMPVMDGFEFLEEFQKLKLAKKVIIIMLTTSSHINDMDKLFHSVNSDIIAKPLTEEKLIKIIHRYFDGNNKAFSQTA